MECVIFPEAVRPDSAFLSRSVVRDRAEPKQKAGNENQMNAIVEKSVVKKPIRRSVKRELVLRINPSRLCCSRNTSEDR